MKQSPSHVLNEKLIPLNEIPTLAVSAGEAALALHALREYSLGRGHGIGIETIALMQKLERYLFSSRLTEKRDAD